MKNAKFDVRSGSGKDKERKQMASKKLYCDWEPHASHVDRFLRPRSASCDPNALLIKHCVFPPAPASDNIHPFGQHPAPWNQGSS
jgi:hypothetical protein